MSNYYEILGIPIEATDLELDAAYLKAVSAYKEGSIAAYGVISEDYRKEILENIETAFTTLKDPDKRREYNKTILQTGVNIATGEKNITPESKREPVGPPVQLALDINGGEAKEPEEKKIEFLPPKESCEQPDDKVSTSFYSELTHLKDVRELKGIGLRDISNETKISVTYLKAIEEANLSEMPEDVYTRGFIRAFAKYLGLNPEEFIASYHRHRSQAEQPTVIDKKD